MSIPDTRRQNAEKLAHFLTEMQKPPAPLDKLPCAYAIPAKKWTCPKAGTMFCTWCRLVAYCSKECQKGDWRNHKVECKDEILSKTWLPAWEKQKRQAIWQEDTPGSSPHDTSMKGMALWANTPGIDLLNLKNNEGVQESRNYDIDIAIAAYHDLRHVVTTVNSLPEDYAGTFTCVINDKEPIVVARSIALLLLLSGSTFTTGGTPVDPAMAAEIATHFWASTYVSPEADFRLTFIISNFLGGVLDKVGRPFHLGAQPENIPMDVPLTTKSRLRGSVQDLVLACLHEWGKRDALDFNTIQREMERVRFNPDRVDLHHRHYVRLDPTHRASFEKYRKDNMVLPFGARREAFTAPNRLLFSPGGRWLQYDLANPLFSWDIEAQAKAGKKHGAMREDLYGCLYFFLSDTLRKFAERLRRFSIDFEFYSEDAHDIAQKLNKASATSGWPTLRKFDRIHLDYKIDPSRGEGSLGQALDDWGPLLKKHPSSCITGLFIFWQEEQKGAKLQSLPTEITAEIFSQYLKEGKITDRTGSRPQTAADGTRLTLAYYPTLNSSLENSAQFIDYLKSKCHLEEATSRNKLLWRLRNHVVPYRVGVPPTDKNTIRSLPGFLKDKDRERWYLNTCVGRCFWTERYAEFEWDHTVVKDL